MLSSSKNYCMRLLPLPEEALAAATAAALELKKALALASPEMRTLVTVEEGPPRPPLNKPSEGVWPCWVEMRRLRWI